MSMKGLGGLPPRRPDQQSVPPATTVAPGSTTVIRARVVIITGGPGSGVFEYSPSPAFGNLSGTTTAAPGTDQYGNAYLAGTSSYLNVPGGSFAISVNDAAVTMYAAPGPQGPWTATGSMTSNQAQFGINGISLGPAVDIQQTLILTPSGDSTGITDQANIQGAYQFVQEVVLTPGRYFIATPITLPSGARLSGGKGNKHVSGGVQIICTAGFTGTAAIVMLGSTSQEQQVDNLTIDGSAMPAGTAIGIAGAGISNYVQLDRLLIIGQGFSNGIRPASGANQASGWRCSNITVNGTSATGILLANCPDHNWLTSQAIGCGDKGWSLNNCQNSRITSCQADFNSTYGFFIQGAWASGNGSGALQLSNCSTDRNQQFGTFITATGNSPIILSGHVSRRDGSSSVSSGYSGICVSNATCPVTIGDWACYPGVDDNGGGLGTPQYGLNLLGVNTLVMVSNAMLQAITAGINGSSGASYRNVWTRTGPTTGPTAPALTPDTA